MYNQFKSHPLKWSTLVADVGRSGLSDPDIWIEDIRRYGPCRTNNEFIKPELVGSETGDETDVIKASFSTIIEYKNNRIIIRHHF